MPDVGLRTIAGPVTAGAIYTKFLIALSHAYDQSLLKWLTQNMPMSDTKEVIGGLGSVPALREHDGTNKFQNLGEEELLIKTIKFQSGFEYDEDLPNHKLWALINPKIAQLAQRANDQAVILLSQTIEANPNCYDGKALFANDHPLKDGGVNDNLLTGTGASQTQFTTDYWAAVAALRLMKDDQGQYLMRPGSSLLVHAPPGLEEVATTLQQAILIGNGNTNIVKNRYDLMIDVLLADPNDWYLYIIGDPNKLITHGEYVKPTIKQYKAENNDLVKVSAKRIHGMVPGDYSLGVKTTNT